MPVITRDRRRACNACGRRFGLGAVFGSGIWAATCRHCGWRSRATGFSFALCIIGLFGALILTAVAAERLVPHWQPLAVVALAGGAMVFAALFFSLFLSYRPVTEPAERPGRPVRPVRKDRPVEKCPDMAPYDELASRIVQGPWGPVEPPPENSTPSKATVPERRRSDEDGGLPYRSTKLDRTFVGRVFSGGEWG